LGRPEPPARPGGPGAAVTRPARQVSAVRADAARAADENAARSGGPPDHQVLAAIDWALGRAAAAPFTGTPTPGGARPGDVADEMAACRRHLRSTPYSEAAADSIRRARSVRAVLAWLTGESDLPPAYTAGTRPGDLVGGRGPVVRDHAAITAMAARARSQLAADDTGWGSGPGWHEGAIATLNWAAGESPDPPMAHPGAGPCSHPPSDGPPGDAEMTRELRAAEEHAEPGGQQHGGHSPGYADAVAATLAWLYGQTTTPPIR
jgi:hypothetical protein